MGNEQVTRMKIKETGGAIPNDAVRAEIGLPNSYTPTPKFLDRLYGRLDKKSAERRKERIRFIIHSQDDTMTQRLIKYIKAFVIGGTLGAFFSSVTHILGPIQYFPFRKLEEYVGDQKRLNFYVGRYIYQRGKLPFLRGGLLVVAYLYLSNLFNDHNQKQRSYFTNHLLVTAILVFVTTLGRPIGGIISGQIINLLLIAPITYSALQAYTGEMMLENHQPMVFYNPGISKKKMKEIEFADFLERQSIMLMSGKVKLGSF